MGFKSIYALKRLKSMLQCVAWLFVLIKFTFTTKRRHSLPNFLHSGTLGVSAGGDDTEVLELAGVIGVNKTKVKSIIFFVVVDCQFGYDLWPQHRSP